MTPPQPDFFWGHLPFWIPIYILALMAWGCIGRFAMQFVVPATSTNYIWRGFRVMTDPPIRLIMVITPRITPPFLLPVIAAMWLFVLRAVVFIFLKIQGLAPSITPATGG